MSRREVVQAHVGQTYSVLGLEMEQAPRVLNAPVR